MSNIEVQSAEDLLNGAVKIRSKTVRGTKIAKKIDKNMKYPDYYIYLFLFCFYRQAIQSEHDDMSNTYMQLCIDAIHSCRDRIGILGFDTKDLKIFVLAIQYYQQYCIRCNFPAKMRLACRNFFGAYNPGTNEDTVRGEYWIKKAIDDIDNGFDNTEHLFRYITWLTLFNVNPYLLENGWQDRVQLPLHVPEVESDSTAIFCAPAGPEERKRFAV